MLGDTAQGVGRVSACRTCPCDGRGVGKVKPLDAAVQDDEAREPLPRPQGPPQQGLTTEGTLGAGTMAGAHGPLACAVTHPHKTPRSSDRCWESEPQAGVGGVLRAAGPGPPMRLEVDK